ncbi:MAG: AfsR/SARP family transcriptional regulator [Solirubrobacteraceae bacterium]
MIGRTRIARRLEATLAVTALLLALALGWELRPALPQLPQSFSAPLPSGTIGTTLDLAAWIVFVLLDLVLIRKVLRFATRQQPTATELRLRSAFVPHAPLFDEPRDWRAYAAPLAPPVLRLPARREGAERELTAPQLQQYGPRELSASVGVAATDAGNERLGVLLLGPLELAGCKKKQPRRQATAELIAYLAVQRRPTSRDELLEALWPGEDPRRAAARFYQAASEARKLLGDVFVRDRDTYNLDREQLRIDLDELDWLREQAHDTDEEREPLLLERALALFRGEPLAGIDALWVDGEQRRLSSLRLNLLDRVGRLRLEAGDTPGALEVANEAEALDGSNEHLVQLAMEAEAALGRREAVVERYERLRRDLDERFGLEPSRETKALYRHLMSQDPDPSLTAP